MVNKTELKAYLARCSIFVLTSIFEMMPITLLEAMASGKSVIASDIPGPQDIIQNGYNGFLVEKCNTKELIKYLKLLIEDKPLREKTGYNARKSVKDKYTFEIVAEKYLKVFSELLE